MHNETSPLQKNKSTTPAKSETFTFLLAEFEQLGEFWRHTDSRIDTSINFYLTSLAVFASASVLLYQSISDTRLFVTILIPVGFFVLITGLFLTSRITNTRLLKKEYALALNRIRRFFVDHDPSFAKYIVLPVASLPEEIQTTNREPNRKIIQDKGYPYFSLLILHVVNGLIMGGIVSAGLWLLFKLELVVVIAIGLVIAGICFIILFGSERRAVRSVQLKILNDSTGTRASEYKKNTSQS